MTPSIIELSKRAVMDRLPARLQTGLRKPRVQARLARATIAHHIDAIAPRQSVWTAVRSYPRYMRERRAFERMGGQRLAWSDDNPQLTDRVARSPFDPHYTYQDAWAARKIYASGVDQHVDIGSRISYVVGLTPFVSVTYVDLRPLDVAIGGLVAQAGNILSLPFADRSLGSVSCLHVAEHIGLGRYGDELDVDGTRKAARELQRVLAPSGTLYLSIPVGRPMVAFNAHRVHDPTEIPTWFDELELASFSGVDDGGAFLVDTTPAVLQTCSWGCGFFEFTRRLSSAPTASKAG